MALPENGIFLTQDDALQQVLGYAGLKNPLKDVNKHNFSERLAEDLRDALTYTDPDRPTLTIHQKLKAVVAQKGIGVGTLTDEQKKINQLYGSLVEDLSDNIDPAFDGFLSMQSEFFQVTLRQKQSQLSAEISALSARGEGALTSEDVKRIRELSGEVEKLEDALINHSRSSISVTGQGGVGSLKAKGQFKTLDDLINSAMPGYTFTGDQPGAGMKIADEILQLEEMDALGILSPEEQMLLDRLTRAQTGAEVLERYAIWTSNLNIKREMGNEATRNMTFNIATSHSSTVFTEPMGLLVDPESMNEQVVAGIRSNLAAAQARTDDFFATGQLPKGFLESLIYEGKQLGLISQEGVPLAEPTIPNTNLPQSALDATTRGLAKRNRAEYQQIFDLLQQGADPKTIPQFVNRLRAYNSTDAFRTKDGEINLALPTARRSEIRTYESGFETFPGVVEGGLDVRDVKLPDGSVVRVPFVQTTAKGELTYMTGTAASQQKGALSTFDLDDTIIGSVRTFLNQDGKIRIAQVTERDPKGLQETFYSVPNFRAASQVQRFFEGSGNISKKMLESFSGATISDEVRQEFIDRGYDPDDIDEVYSQFKTILRPKADGTFGYKSTMGTEFFPGENQVTLAEAMIERSIRTSIGAPIPEIPSDQLATLAKLGSSSIRGRNAIDPATGMTVQVAKSLGAEQAAPYSLRNVSEFMTRAAPAEETMAEALRLVNDQLPASASRLTLEQLGPFMAGTHSVAGLSPRDAEQIGNFAIEQLSEAETLKAVLFSETRNTIGVSSNRAAIVASAQNMINEAMGTGEMFKEFGPYAPQIGKRFLGNYGINTISPSNVVDLVKQVSGGNVVVPLAEALAQTTNAQERESITSAYEALATVGRRLGKKTIDGRVLTAENVSNFEIGDILEAKVDQSAKAIGVTRASDIASGKTSGELIGFDPVAFAERMTVPEDRAAVRANIVQGMREYLEQATGYVPISQRKRVMDELERIEAMNADEFEKSIFLQPETPLYDRHANTAKAKALALEAQINESKNDIATRRLAARSQRALGVAEYRGEARKFLGRPEVSDLFKEMQRLGEIEAEAISKGEKLSEGFQEARKVIKSQLAMQMSTSLRAIRDNVTGSGNVLDIIDTLESEMATIYGEQGRSIFTQLGKIGAEDQMMSIYDLAIRRRSLIGQNNNMEHFNYVQELYRDHKGSASADLSRLTPESAQEHIRFDRSLEVGDRRMAPELFDFMTLRARTQTALGQMDGEPIDSLSATEAFRSMQRLEAAAKIERELAEITGSEAFTGPVTEDVARLAEELAIRDADDTIGPIARSPYKRITESFQGGELKKLLESKNVRRSGVAAIALIGGSFLYQRNKRKDLTEADVSGPPLLPGGSAYEDRPATRQMALQSAQIQSQGYGMQYQVNTTGSMADLNRLRGLFGDVVDGPINSTMYNGMPSLGKDPYSDIASNF